MTWVAVGKQMAGIGLVFDPGADGADLPGQGERPAGFAQRD